MGADWPAKSAGLNIVEDIWKLLSDQVYDGAQFVHAVRLTEKLGNVIDEINRCQRQKVLDLYESVRGRLCTVLYKRDALYNK